MRIIAFSGRKQSGKTTAVEDLSSRLWDEKSINAEQLNFADQLKRLVLDYFIGPDTGKVYCISDLDSEKFKTTVHSCGKTYRELLQIVGTGQFRGLWPDVWVKNYKQCLPDGEDFILTADVRFPNEVKCIQDLGGHVIRLLRNPHDDQHESETALDEMEYGTRNGFTANSNGVLCRFDAIIDNRNMSIEELKETVWKLVNEKGWL